MVRRPALPALLAAAASLALAGAATDARAAQFVVSYQAISGGPAAADFTLTVADAVNAAGGYDVTGITGDVDGDAITGLIANPNQPFASYSADGMFIFDNVLFPTEPRFSNPGLFFSAASGNEYNLFSDAPHVYELYRAQPHVAYLDHSVGDLTAGRIEAPTQFDVGGAVPEPAAWALMILGFGAIGATLRRRRALAAV